MRDDGVGMAERLGEEMGGVSSVRERWKGGSRIRERERKVKGQRERHGEWESLAEESDRDCFESFGRENHAFEEED